MAYQTGSATGVADLIDKLLTFASGLSTTPWAVEEDHVQRATLSLGDCYVTWMWEFTDPDMMVCYQSLGWDAGGTPYQYQDDSGSGNTTAPSANYRQVNFITSGPYTTYHFFAGEGAEPYIHVVVEVDAGRFRHFGFGNLVKYNDWDGGEYCYGTNWSQSTSYIDSPTREYHQCGLDGSNSPLNTATVHAEGLPNQDPLGKWGSLVSEGALSGNDRAGNPRAVMFGSARSGLWTKMLTWMRASLLNSYKPMVPIEVLYMDPSGTTDAISLLGYQPDVAVINMGSLSVGDTITVGSDEWMVFPWAKKLYVHLGSNTEESWNAGFAYRKIT